MLFLSFCNWRLVIVETGLLLIILILQLQLFHIGFAYEGVRLFEFEVFLDDHENAQEACHFFFIDLAIIVIVDQLKYFIYTIAGHQHIWLYHLADVLTDLLLVNFTAPVDIIDYPNLFDFCQDFDFSRQRCFGGSGVTLGRTLDHDLVEHLLETVHDVIKLLRLNAYPWSIALTLTRHNCTNLCLRLPSYGFFLYLLLYLIN